MRVVTLLIYISQQVIVNISGQWAISFMKINKKYLFLFFGFLLLIVPGIALAADKWIPPTLSIPIPTLTGFSAPEKCDTAPDGQPIYCVGWLGEYVGAIYKYAIGIIGIVAAIALMIGGVRWLTAGGNPSAVKDAQSWITGAITGLIIGLASYLILYQINPNLIIFKPIRVKMVKEVAITSGSDRLFNCSWETTCETGLNGKKIDDSGKCGEKVGDTSDANVAAQVCCCHEKPLPNCQWETDCSAGREPADGAGCGTFYGGLAEKCCCSKATSGACIPQDAGPCNWQNFMTNFRDERLAKQASAVCNAESGNSGACPLNPSLAAGPMQIHIVKHYNKLPGCVLTNSDFYRCGTWGNNYPKWCVTSGKEPQLENCRQQTCIPSVFSNVAYQIYHSAGNSWSPWSVYSGQAGNKSCSDGVYPF